MTCPHAKLLAGGTLMCPCHGMAKESARVSPPRRAARTFAESIDLRRTTEADRMAAGLVRALEDLIQESV